MIINSGLFTIRLTRPPDKGDPIVTKKIILALATLSMTPSLAHAVPASGNSPKLICPVWNGTAWIYKPCPFIKH